MARTPRTSTKRQRSIAQEKIDPGDALHNLNDTFLKCRRGNLGHTWDEIGYWYEGTDRYRELECKRCHTRRTDHWDHRGNRYASQYTHADGYLLVGTGGVEPIDVRLEVLDRVKLYASHDSMTKAVFNGGKRRRRK